jgi:protein-S-isoprenylcysteine O-methyltransferase Ste14
LYVGLLALHLAIALLVPSFWAVVALPVSWLLVWWGAVRPEERFLRDRFGEEYDAYARRVRRWL